MLCVDDQPEILEVIKLFLEKENELSVSTVEDPVRALSIITQGNYDAIISDYQMPGLDGIEFLRKLRSQGNYNPFILFTGSGKEEVAIEALNNGVDFYVQKGGDPEVQFGELKNAIIKLAQKRLTEESHEESEGMYCRILNCTGECIILSDDRNIIIYANHRATELVMAPKEVIVGSMITDYIAAESKDSATMNLTKRIEGVKSHAEYKLKRLDNRELWADVSANPIINEGQFEGTVYAVADITNRKEMEYSLRTSEAKYRQIVDTALEGIWTFDLEWKTTFVNDSLASILGYSKEEMQGCNVLSFMDENSQQIFWTYVHDEHQQRGFQDHDLLVYGWGQPLPRPSLHDDRVDEDKFYTPHVRYSLEVKCAS